MVDLNPISDIVITIDENFENFAISSRYTLEANIYFRGSTGVLGQSYYSTIANPVWLENLYTKAVSLLEYVASKIDWFVIQEFHKIDIDKLLERSKRLSELKK